MKIALWQLHCRLGAHLSAYHCAKVSCFSLQFLLSYGPGSILSRCYGVKFRLLLLRCQLCCGAIPDALRGQNLGLNVHLLDGQLCLLFYIL